MNMHGNIDVQMEERETVSKRTSSSCIYDITGKLDSAAECNSRPNKKSSVYGLPTDRQNLTQNSQL